MEKGGKNHFASRFCILNADTVCAQKRESFEIRNCLMSQILLDPIWKRLRDLEVENNVQNYIFVVFVFCLFHWNISLEIETI